MEKTYQTRGVLTLVNDAVTADTRDMNTALVTFNGTYAGTAVFEGTDTENGSIWYPIQAARIDANSVATSHSTTNGTTGYEFSCHAFLSVRVRRTVATSGDMNVAISATARAVEPAPTSQLPAGTMPVAVNASTTTGTTTYVLNSTAGVNAVNIKATTGALYGFAINNTTAADKYVRLYRKSTAPVVGTDTPAMVITVKANTSKEVQFSTQGFAWTSGIGIAITNAAPILDATAVAAGDVQVVLNYV